MVAHMRFATTAPGNSFAMATEDQAVPEILDLLDAGAENAGLRIGEVDGKRFFVGTADETRQMLADLNGKEGLQIFDDDHGAIFFALPTTEEKVVSALKGAAGGLLAGAAVGALVSVAVLSGGTAAAGAGGAAYAAAEAGEAIGAAALRTAATNAMYSAEASVQLGGVVGASCGGIAGTKYCWDQAGNRMNKFLEGVKAGAIVGGGAAAVVAAALLMKEAPEAFASGRGDSPSTSLPKRLEKPSNSPPTSNSPPLASNGAPAAAVALDTGSRANGTEPNNGDPDMLVAAARGAAFILSCNLPRYK